MRTVRLLTLFTQLGLSVVTPLVMFIWGAVYLRDTFGWGSWVVFLGIFLGGYSAFYGFKQIISAMRREAEAQEKEKDPPPVSYNDHI